MKTKKTLNFKVWSLSGQANLQCTVDQLIRRLRAFRSCEGCDGMQL